jgi:hypothetical protein
MESRDYTYFQLDLTYKIMERREVILLEQIRVLKILIKNLTEFVINIG